MVMMCLYYPRQVVHIHVPLSPGSVVWYWPRAVLLSSWEGEGNGFGCLLADSLGLESAPEPQKITLSIEVPLPFTYDNQKY